MRIHIDFISGRYVVNQGTHAPWNWTKQSRNWLFQSYVSWRWAQDRWALGTRLHGRFNYLSMRGAIVSYSLPFSSPELSIPAAGQKDRGSGFENDSLPNQIFQILLWTWAMMSSLRMAVSRCWTFPEVSILGLTKRRAACTNGTGMPECLCPVPYSSHVAYMFPIYHSKTFCKKPFYLSLLLYIYFTGTRLD